MLTKYILAQMPYKYLKVLASLKSEIRIKAEDFEILAGAVKCGFSLSKSTLLNECLHWGNSEQVFTFTSWEIFSRYRV